MRKNEDIRNAIKAAGIHYWEVAQELGITDCTFSKWLRYDLTKERREAIMKAIRTVEKRMEN